ncbi:FG-GAP repeat protein [Streptomyces sp. NPDC102467]|uniref:FG-GAP repeat protein n=1 Tax=Streptomyces sp. NPDC102467 TaxID=3366179 RepID=UPI0038234B2C
MAKHGRLPASPPTRIRIATANTSAAPLTGGLLAASAGTARAPGSSEAGDGFGRVSAYGDFNHDGFDDLAVGAEHEKVSTDVDGGTLAILKGSACGLPGGTTIADPAASSHVRWGAALTASDTNDDGCPMFEASAAN